MTVQPQSEQRNPQWVAGPRRTWLIVGGILFIGFFVVLPVSFYFLVLHSEWAGRPAEVRSRPPQTGPAIRVRPTPKPEPPGRRAETLRLWYQGGTLHRATLDEWRTSTPENRLATAADFASAILKPTSIEQVRQPAADLEACISEVANKAVTDPAKGFGAERAVTEVGAVCAALLKWK